MRLRTLVRALGVTGALVSPAELYARQARPQPTPAVALDAALRRSIADSIAAVLEERYVDTTLARQLGARLRGRVRSGAYDGAATPQAYATLLMREVQSIVPDKHLRVTYEPERDFGPGGPAAPRPDLRQPPRVIRDGFVVGSAPRAAAAPGTPAAPARWSRIDPRDSAEVARANFHFDRVERLAGNVGYLKLSRFVPLDWARPTAVAAMQFLANADAVIIDVRGNIGGSPDLVMMLESWFLPPEPRALFRTYNRAMHVVNERWSMDSLPVPRKVGTPLYILQDRNSASSAEMIGYVARQQGIATLVGDTTAGAGNGGNNLSVGAGIALFIPQFRVVSGPGYERTGVAPDVLVPADSALAVAHRLALGRLVAAAGDSLVRREREWALELLRPATVDAARLPALAGEYGPRRFVVRGGTLVHVGTTGQTTPLVPVGTDVFRGPATRFTFERDASGRVVAVRVETPSGAPSRLLRGDVS